MSIQLHGVEDKKQENSHFSSASPIPSSHLISSPPLQEESQQMLGASPNLSKQVINMQTILVSFAAPIPCRTSSTQQTFRTFFCQKKQVPICCTSWPFKIERKHEQWNTYEQYSKGSRGRRCFVLFSLVSLSSFVSLSASGKVKSKNPYDERRLLEQNKKIQEANKAPDDFPNFIREGFQVKVVASDDYVKCDSGLVYLDIEVGKGDCPKAGQQVTFHYVGYNESGRRIDSTYLQGTPARIQIGTNSLVPGFEEGIRDMKPGGKRRIIIPPELGPPVGPSTFFSSKQFEVFDVELLSVQNCQRRTIVFYSDVVCD